MRISDWSSDVCSSDLTYVKEVVRDVEAQDRPAVLLYAGDFDPSGEDIDRDFTARTDCFAKVVRVALNAEQVTEYDLPPAMGKATDSRASRFVERSEEHTSELQPLMHLTYAVFRLKKKKTDKALTPPR